VAGGTVYKSDSDAAPGASCPRTLIVLVVIVMHPST
jgi:hypothetical protein